MPVTLQHLQVGEPLYNQIVQFFTSGWDRGQMPLPHIKHIFYVKHLSDNAQRHLMAYSNYSNSVGNIQYLFHGTQRSCRTGDEPNWTTPCNHADCFLCSIIKCSFNFNLAGSAHGKMFGSGVYTTSTSSKAAQYAVSTDRNTQNRVVLLSNVAVGNTYLARTADSSLRAPPPGYNSVTGATYAQGGVLVHPETVVYRQDAICVSAVVVYSN